MHRSSFPFLWETAGRDKFRILLLTLVRSLLSVSGVAYALLLRELVDSAAAGAFHRFACAGGLFAATAAGYLLLGTVARYLSALTRANLENSFKRRLFHTLLHRELGDVAAVHSAQWMNQLTNDTRIVADTLTDLMPDFFGMLLQLGTALAALLVLEPRLGWLVLPAGLILLIFSALFRKRMKQLHKDIQQTDGSLREALQEALTGMTVVRAYSVEDPVEQQAEDRMVTHKRARIRRNLYSNVCNLGFGLLMNGGYVLGALFCGYGLLQGTMGLGDLVAVIQLVGLLQSPLANISGILPMCYSLTASAERLMEAEQLPEPSGPEPLPEQQVRQYYSQDFSRIAMDHVTFSYGDGEAPVLRDFSFQLHRQEFVAFTGHSGCGKSTVFRLLLGLYHPESGSCRVLNRQGESRDLQAMRRLFAYVPQGNFFLSGSVRQVVAFGDPSRAGEDAELWAALDTVCAGDFVRQLPQGLDAVLGERGLGLSEGQLQRLSLARAVFSRRPILLLDEATSALDPDTERQVLCNLQAMTDRTVLIVTHRPAALSICHRTVHFEDQEV